MYLFVFYVNDLTIALCEWTRQCDLLNTNEGKLEVVCLDLNFLIDVDSTV